MKDSICSFDSLNVTPSTGSDNLPMYVAIADSANAKPNDLKLSWYVGILQWIPNKIR